MSDEPSNIVRLPEQQSPVAAYHAMLDRAWTTGNMEIIKGTMDLLERREDRAALIAFNRAMAAAKAEIPEIVKDRVAKFDHRAGGGRTEYSYVELASICRAVDPALSKHGLYYRWRTVTDPNKPIEVTCIVFHEQGHSEENSLSAASDTSGSKNHIQAMVSAVTYMKRDTLCSALGIAAGRDDDAQTAGKPVEESVPISEAEVESVRKRIVALGIDQAVFYTVMSKHAGRVIARLEELHSKDMKYCWQCFDEFEAHQKKQQKKAPAQ